MFSLLKKAWLFVLVSAGSFIVVQNTDPIETVRFLPSYLEERKLTASQYTQMDDLSVVDEGAYISLLETDEIIQENDALILYFNPATTTFKLQDKATGYIFASHIDAPDAGTFNGLLESSIGIDFMNTERNYDLRENVGLSQTIHTVAQSTIPGGLQLDIQIGGFCSTRACERLYPAYVAGNYTLEEMIAVGFNEINVAFTVRVTLEEAGLNVHVPFDSIEESSETILLGSIILFPGFGASEMDQIPGYMMIPEGSGALIRNKDNQGAFLSPYQAPYYGPDPGIPSNRLNVSNYHLMIPSFGAVHGVYQHGFLGFIEAGDLSARLMAYPNGSLNQPYNLIFPKYDYRRIFRQSFTTDQSSGAPRQLQTLHSDITVSYTFLTGPDAHYVGMANVSRERLGLTPLEKTTIPLSVTYLMADSEPSFFGSTLIEMTSVDHVRRMHESLMAAGIQHFDVTLMGFNDGGYSGHLPVRYDPETRLGSARDFRDLYAFLNASSTVNLVNSYVHAAENSDASTRTDMVSGVDRFKLTEECDDCVYETTGVLRAASAQSMFNRDLAFLTDHDLYYFDSSLGSVLSTMYQGGLIGRSESVEIYQAMVASGKLNVAQPNAYLVADLEAAYYMPSYHSNLEYFDDLIPYTSYVYGPSMKLYSSFLNFNSMGRSQILKLIDFNIYPAYLVTDAPANRLKDSDLSGFYTTEFALWETTILDDYTYMKDALEPLLNQTLLTRDVIALGVVKQTYENGHVLYINYQSEAVEIDGVTVGALDIYYVGGTE